jgi:hypothetical protein
MPESLIHCSFCDKSQHEVQTVIAGPNVYICNGCVAVCNDILRHVSKPRRWLGALLRMPDRRGERNGLSTKWTYCPTRRILLPPAARPICAVAP